MKNRIHSIIDQDCVGILDRINLDRLTNSQILITGSNGLLGGQLARTICFANELHNLNCKLYCVSLHKPNKQIERLLTHSNAVPIQADLSKPFSFGNKVDYIFHAACYAQPKLWLQDKLKTIGLNVDTVRSMLDIARKNRARFMFFSSLDVYGDVPRDLVPVPETYSGNCSTTGPRAAYGESKRLGETICSVYRNNYKVNAYIVRISHVYGPGVSIHDERVLGNFIKKALLDKEIKMLDEGKSVKTFGYISDIVYMLLKVMLEGKEFIYNVGGVDTVSIKTLAEEVSKCCGNVPVIIPKRKAKLEHIGTDPDYVGLDISKFIEEFGKVHFMNFSKGIQRTVDWNRQQSDIGATIR